MRKAPFDIKHLIFVIVHIFTAKRRHTKLTLPPFSPRSPWRPFSPDSEGWNKSIFWCQGLMFIFNKFVDGFTLISYKIIGMFTIKYTWDICTYICFQYITYVFLCMILNTILMFYFRNDRSHFLTVSLTISPGWPWCPSGPISPFCP